MKLKDFIELAYTEETFKISFGSDDTIFCGLKKDIPEKIKDCEIMGFFSNRDYVNDGSYIYLMLKRK